MVILKIFEDMSALTPLTCDKKGLFMDRKIYYYKSQRTFM